MPTRSAGPQPFGLTVYGFDNADSYGYPGGLSLAPVASVTNVALAPKTATNPVNTQHCVTATVTDQNGAPVVGVRVDFAVTGVNPTTGFSNTAANGTAQFCYTGTQTGNDTIRASVGTVVDTAAKTWTAGTTNSPTTCVVTAVRAGPPAQQDVTVTDPDGIATITAVNVINGTVAVPAFTPGVKTPIVLTATKTIQTKKTFWEFDVTDSKGVKKHCV